MSNLYVYVLQGHRAVAHFEVAEAARGPDTAHRLPDIPISVFKPAKFGRRMSIVIIEAASEALAIAALRGRLAADALRDRGDATVQ